MTLRRYLVRTVVPLLMTGLVLACGGKTLGGSVRSGEDSGVAATEGGGAAGCVDLEVLPSDLSCGSDQDCTFSRSGNVCNGDCALGCGGTPVNVSAAARYESETSSLTFEGCPCLDPGEPRCLGGQCALCGFGPDQPAGCNVDGGIVTFEDGGIFIVDGGELDMGISDADGGTCVDIELASYDQSCNQPSDCTLIQTGEVCSGQCACGGSPVNVAGQSRYDQATSGIAFGHCGCPAEFPIECRQIGPDAGSTCVVLPP